MIRPYKNNIDNILNTRCPGKRLSNELQREWTSDFQNQKKTFYINTNKNIMTFYMFFDNFYHPITITFKFWNLHSRSLFSSNLYRSVNLIIAMPYQRSS